MDNILLNPEVEQQVLKVLDEMQQSSTELVQVLQREYACLRENQSDKLHELTQAKKNSLLALNNQQRELSVLLSMSVDSKAEDLSAMQQLSLQSAAIQSLWQSVKDQMQSIQQQNIVNGQIIAKNIEVNNTFMELLFDKPSPNMTYDQLGRIK